MRPASSAGHYIWKLADRTKTELLEKRLRRVRGVDENRTVEPPPSLYQVIEKQCTDAEILVRGKDSQDLADLRVTTPTVSLAA